MRRILSVLLENESGALSRVVGLFAQRGYNIETLNVAPTDDHSLSRLTVTINERDIANRAVPDRLDTNRDFGCSCLKSIPVLSF